MKKLLLLGAILVVGTTAFGYEYANVATQGGNFNYGTELNTLKDGEHFYSDETQLKHSDVLLNDNVVKVSNLRNITKNDKVDGREGVNMFRLENVNGKYAEAETEIVVDIMRPVEIESEEDMLAFSAMPGEHLEIGDLTFELNGTGQVTVDFQFTGDLFKSDVLDKGSQARVKGCLDCGFSEVDVDLTNVGFLSASGCVCCGECDEPALLPKVEVDLYLNFKEDAIGTKEGRIIATARYE